MKNKNLFFPLTLMIISQEPAWSRRGIQSQSHVVLGGENLDKSINIYAAKGTGFFYNRRINI